MTATRSGVTVRVGATVTHIQDPAMAARWLEVLTAAACGEGGKTEIGTRTLVESKKEGANRGRNSFKKTLKTMVGDTSYGECATVTPALLQMKTLVGDASHGECLAFNADNNSALSSASLASKSSHNPAQCVIQPAPSTDSSN